MKVGIVAINFGEPIQATPEHVVPFLERIFLTNADLEAFPDEDSRRKRSRDLAERRAPGLIAEYEQIGVSPMNEQARAQARELGLELVRRGRAAHVYSAFQFTPPLIADAVRRARADGVERLVGLPIYPLCGPSTTVAALRDLRAAVDELDWDVDFRAISGWHRHPLYLELRADTIRRFAAHAEVDLGDPGTRLVFSAHGTPMKYVTEGSRYVEYVEEFCAEVASLLGVEKYSLGYQNHTNRGIEWTGPDIEQVVEDIDAECIVVDPVSFMHEQSETLAELDRELRNEAEKAGLEFHRVPVPHGDSRFPRLLADVVESATLEGRTGSELRFSGCRCASGKETVCLNALPREAAAPRPESVKI